MSAFIFWRWKDTDTGADQIDRVILSLPLLGDIRLKHQVATFSRMLSTLLTGGMPLLPSLETAGASMGSRKIVKGVQNAAVRVKEGQSLAKSLDEQKIFPDMAVEMIEVGESTGALPAMLNSVAEFYEDDVNTRMAATLALIEPAIMIFMGIFVAFVLLALYMPIFSLGEKLEELRSMLSRHSERNFSAVFSRSRTRLEAVVTFLALLELIRIGEVSVVQSSAFAEIQVRSCGRKVRDEHHD